jgi:hypothetical protein
VVARIRLPSGFAAMNREIISALWPVEQLSNTKTSFGRRLIEDGFQRTNYVVRLIIVLDDY